MLRKLLLLAFLTACDNPDYSHTDVNRAQKLTVSIRTPEGYRGLCNGVVTGPNEVTTVKHCIENKERRLLKYNTWLTSSGSMCTFTVKTCVKLPGLSDYHDDGLCTLETSCTFSDYAKSTNVCRDPVLVKAWEHKGTYGFEDHGIVHINPKHAKQGWSGSGIWCDDKLAALLGGSQGTCAPVNKLSGLSVHFHFR